MILISLVFLFHEFEIDKLLFFFKIENHSIDRKTFVRRESDGSYTVKRTLTRGNGPAKEVIQSYSAESMMGFISGTIVIDGYSKS